MKSRDAITSKNIHLWVTYNRLSWVKTRDAIASKILFSKNIVKMVDLVSVFHGFPVALTEESSFIGNFCRSFIGNFIRSFIGNFVGSVDGVGVGIGVDAVGVGVYVPGVKSHFNFLISGGDMRL